MRVVRFLSDQGLALQDDPTDQIFIFYPDELKVGVKTIKVLAERMRNEGVQRAIMVVQTNMTPFAKQCLQEMQPKYCIELVSMLQKYFSLCLLVCNTGQAAQLRAAIVSLSVMMIAAQDSARLFDLITLSRLISLNLPCSSKSKSCWLILLSMCWCLSTGF